MSTLIVHILVGEQVLFEPEITTGKELARLCGPDYFCVPAYWLTSKCGFYDHEFLSDPAKDNRINVFARSLVTDYARALRPMLIIPSLSDLSAETMSVWGPVLKNLQNSILALGRECLFQLHMLTLPDITSSFKKLEKLQNWMVEQGLANRVAEDAVVHVSSAEGDLQSRFERNFFASKVITAITSGCRLQGFCLSDSEKLKGAVSQRVKYMANMGLQPVIPHDDALIARVSAAVIADAVGLLLPVKEYTA